MCREYYLHKRQGGIFYVQFVNPENGKLMTARSTGETDKLKAQVQVELFKRDGSIPTGRARKPKLIEEAAGTEAIITTIRKAGHNADDAMRSVSALKGIGLIDIAAVKNTGRGAIPFIQFLESFWDYDNRSTYKTSSLMATDSVADMPMSAKNGSIQ